MKIKQNQYKNREILSKIIKYLKIPEIIVLHGSRQVRKTTLMKITTGVFEGSKSVRFYFEALVL